MIFIFIGLFMFLFFGFMYITTGGYDPFIAKLVCIGFVLMLLGIPVALIQIALM